MVKSSMFWLVPALLVVFGCATSAKAPAVKSPAEEGMMPARWTPPGGATQPIPISWESSSPSHGVIHATLGKGGERFDGKYVRVESGKKAVITTVYADWSAQTWEVNAWDPVTEGTGFDYEVFVKHYSGKVLATLFGDRGHAMRCRFTLQDPELGLLQGGVGECQVSDGGKIDVEF